MSHAHTVLTLLLLFLVFTIEGALYGHLLSRCQFSSYNGRDAVYLEQYYFEKLLIAQYNSTLGTMIGYTKKGTEIAIFLNGKKEFVTHQKWKTNICKTNSQLAYKSLLKPVEPYVRLRSLEAASSKHPGLLMCSVYDFYPKQIQVTWLRDGKEVTSDVSSTDELTNGNWLYQIHSYLEVTPRPGEKITCMVEHSSFQQPMLYDWDAVSDPGSIKIAVGIAGLLLGLMFSVAGLIYYKKKSNGNHLYSQASRPAPSDIPEAPVTPVFCFSPSAGDVLIQTDGATGSQAFNSI